MRALDIANILIARHGQESVISNLSLNKLVYYAQVESLRTNGQPLFTDRIEAWKLGPVEPDVYHCFKQYGSNRIAKPVSNVIGDSNTNQIIENMFDKYGHMTAYDLVTMTHLTGSAWSRVYRKDKDVEITINDILNSQDGISKLDDASTLAASIKTVDEKWPNTFKLLRNA